MTQNLSWLIIFQQDDLDEKTENYLLNLQRDGTMDSIVANAKRVGRTLDKNLGGGGKTGLAQFMSDYKKHSESLHVTACKTLADAKDEEIFSIHKYLLSRYPKVFGVNSRQDVRNKGHYMTIATCEILTRMKKKGEIQQIHHLSWERVILFCSESERREYMSANNTQWKTCARY